MLVRTHQHGIRHFLRRLTAGDHAWADDLAQEVFIRAYQKLSSYRADASFSTWLHSIAYRYFLNQQRKGYRQHEVSGLELLEQTAAESSAEKELFVAQLMRHLSLPERTCLTLSISAGLSHQDIVSVTELPLGTVKSHITRGKAKLAKVINASATQQEVAP